ncbi:MAG: hypothetical protein ACYSWU_09640 [Planctomycetota bacterium]|jgi:hypothetical protein
MNDQDTYESDPQSLTEMLDLEAGEQKLWAPEELGAILEHQLAAPLECDLAKLDSQLTMRLRALNSVSDTAIKTFGDLLHHPSPPLRFLEVTKQFAKACRNHPHSPLPDEVATVLYFLSIVVAITKCSGRITKMDDRSLEYSLNWALRQPWLDQATRGILQEGLDAIGRPGPEAK